MKHRPKLILLAALLGLAAGSRVFAAETKWSPAQAEIAAHVHAWEVASLAGDVDTIMKLTAPGFMGWDLTKPAPIDRAAYRAEQASFFGHFKVLECALPITAIQVEHDTAAVHGRYREAVQDTTGARLILQGSWTASLHHIGGQWLFLSLGCLADPPATDAAAIKAEVAQALTAFTIAVEKVNLADTLGAAADVPEFRYVMPDGTVADFAGWKQGHSEYFSTVAAHRFFPKSQDIAVLGPDAALVTWTGAMEIVPKTGPVLRIDPFSASFVFKRLGSAWRLVAQQESGPPAKAAVGSPRGTAAPGAARDSDRVRQAVAQTMSSFVAACERVDLVGALAFMADVPEFRYADPEGKLLAFAATKQGLAEWFGQCSAQRVVTARQEIAVLGPDAALVQWHGALELVLKDGKTLRADPYNASFLFRRIGDAWKIAYQHESGPPPQPAGAAQASANVEAQLRAADTELVAAANARDLERWLACFEESARLFPPDGPPIAGKAAIRPAAEELMKSPSFAVVHRIDGVEVSPCGTLAWVDYAFELTVSGPDGRPITETGRDTTLYRKGPDGRWRVVADIWRPHAPATGD